MGVHIQKRHLIVQTQELENDVKPSYRSLF